jgi:hypothetical protein
MSHVSRFISFRDFTRSHGVDALRLIGPEGLYQDECKGQL